MDQTTNLAALREGESGYVTGIFAQSSMARRLIDLGLVPGTRVTHVASSPAGDPCAYLIRGAVIALRRGDAEGVRLERAGASAPGPAAE